MAYSVEYYAMLLALTRQSRGTQRVLGGVLVGCSRGTGRVVAGYWRDTLFPRGTYSRGYREGLGSSGRLGNTKGYPRSTNVPQGVL
jgi:hypothetical protein